MIKKNIYYSDKKFNFKFNLKLILKKVLRVVEFNEKAGLKRCINMNTEKKNAKTDCEKRFFKLINNLFFRKSMENVKKKNKMCCQVWKTFFSEKHCNQQFD